MTTFEPEPGQQTFTDEHWDEVAHALCGSNVAAMEALYRGSYSATFAADLRAVVRQVVRPHVIDRWESR